MSAIAHWYTSLDKNKKKCVRYTFLYHEDTGRHLIMGDVRSRTSGYLSRVTLEEILGFLFMAA